MNPEINELLDVPPLSDLAHTLIQILQQLFVPGYHTPFVVPEIISVSKMNILRSFTLQCASNSEYSLIGLDQQRLPHEILLRLCKTFLIKC